MGRANRKEELTAAYMKGLSALQADSTPQASPTAAPTKTLSSGRLEPVTTEVSPTSAPMKTLASGRLNPVKAVVAASPPPNLKENSRALANVEKEAVVTPESHTVSTASSPSPKKSQWTEWAFALKETSDKEDEDTNVAKAVKRKKKATLPGGKVITAAAMQLIQDHGEKVHDMAKTKSEPQRARKMSVRTSVRSVRSVRSTSDKKPKSQEPASPQARI